MLLYNMTTSKFVELEHYNQEYPDVEYLVIKNPPCNDDDVVLWAPYVLIIKHKGLNIAAEFDGVTPRTSVYGEFEGKKVVIPLGKGGMHAKEASLYIRFMIDREDMSKFFGLINLHLI
jgi:hypothetical protein